jgi:hypothetical protein
MDALEKAINQLGKTSSTSESTNDAENIDELSDITV